METKMKIPNVIVAEYSHSQNCFHIQSLADSIKDNLEDTIGLCKPDWVVIGVFNDDLDAHRFIEEVRAAQKDIIEKGYAV